MWQIKKLTDLTSLEFYQIARLRNQTFVIEQNRLYPELDDIDLTCYHCFYCDSVTHEITAYSRIFLENDAVTFGRVVTAQSTRGTGLGNILLQQVLNFCTKTWPDKPVFIEAQTQVIGFYEKHGFVAVGEEFIFNLTPHIRMELKKADKSKIN